MYRRKPQGITELVAQMLREQGLETPLQQKRLIDAWDAVVGPTIASYTKDKFIKNQTLMVKIVSPALRADLSMIRTQLVQKLNDAVGAQIITEVRIY